MVVSEDGIVKLCGDPKELGYDFYALLATINSMKEQNPEAYEAIIEEMRVLVMKKIKDAPKELKQFIINLNDLYD